jgi:glycerol-3-phosphate acyltransferase PlsY
MTAVIFILAAYLLGSVSFAIVVSKVFRLDDPRTYGSQNPGATNVLRSGNKLAAILTLLGDCVKGWVAVAVVVGLNESLQLGDAVIAGVALAVFAGHLWPVFFRFQGGKGVATALGVLLGLNPVLGLATLATWLIIARAFRYSSLAALAAAIFAPFYYGLLFGVRAQLLAVAIMSVLLIYRHRSNIANLLSGKENRIGQKKEEPPVSTDGQ